MADDHTDLIDRRVDPADVGLDAGELERLDDHLRGYVDDGRFPGWQVVVSRHGRVAHHTVHGVRDAAGTPVTPTTRWRIFSMTKPIVSVAAMALVEQGRLDVDAPVGRWLPELADLRRAADPDADPDADELTTVPCDGPLLVRHLLTHTAGFGYGMSDDAVDRAFKAAGASPTGAGPEVDLAEWVRRVATVPLKREPGTRWEYGISTDVLGRLLEVAGDAPLDEVVDTLVTGPLGMTQTRFRVGAEPDDPDELGDLWIRGEDGERRLAPPAGFPAGAPPWLSAGGGMVGSARDYRVFTQMLLGDGEVDSVRVLRPETVDAMGRNQLPGGRELSELTVGGFSETSGAASGFGYGFSVKLEDGTGPMFHAAGEMAWGGAASTAFWVDRTHDLAVEFYTQVLPSPAFTVRNELRAFVYRALGW